MNRSRYVPPAYHSISPYHQQPYGALPTTTAPPGMMPTQPLAMPPSGFGGMSPQPGVAQSPMQTQLSPGAMWTTTFANGPIIEDLIAPPMGIPSASPPINAFPPRMAAMGAMHPGAMPQVQNVFGVRQPMPPMPPPPHQFAAVQGLGLTMPGLPQPARMVGAYPPYGVAGQQQLLHQQQQQQQQHQQQMAGMMYAQREMDPGPRLETGFPAAGSAGSPGAMQQMASPPIGGSPASQHAAMAPLTPSEGSLAGFLSPDLGQ